jgi:DNA-binding MarR family transcriptional regulator
MSALSVNEKMDFNSLKELLDLTDGNLASHIKALEKEDYIGVEKKFIGKKTNTNYKITEIGLIEFKKHLDALENFINEQK